MLTVDVVLFRAAAAVDEVLLVRRSNEPFAGRWALPGGFVDEHEKPQHAARRELAEETCVAYAGPLEQVGAFGDPGRDPRGWTVTIAYRGRLEAGDGDQARGADDAEEAAWHSLEALPSLAFDHDRILAAAVGDDEGPGTGRR